MFVFYLIFYIFRYLFHITPSVNRPERAVDRALES